jgi:hypothetical protein
MGASNKTWIIAAITSTFLIACLLMICMDVITIRRQRKEQHRVDDTCAEEEEDDNDDTIPSNENISVDLGCEQDSSSISINES